MAGTQKRTLGRYARHRRLRKKVVGVPGRPRLSVFRSHRHLYVQLVDDAGGKTILGCSTLDERLKKSSAHGNVSSAVELGKLVATEAKKRGITRVVFDRGGYLYHGRVKAVADAVRAEGVQV